MNTLKCEEPLNQTTFLPVTIRAQEGATEGRRWVSCGIQFFPMKQGAVRSCR